MTELHFNFERKWRFIIESKDWPTFISCRSQKISKWILLEKIKHLIKSEKVLNLQPTIVCSKREEIYLLEEFLKNNLRKKRRISAINVTCLDDLFKPEKVVSSKCFIFYDCLGDLLSQKRINRANEVFSEDFEFLLFLDQIPISKELIEKFSFKNNAKIFNLSHEEYNANSLLTKKELFHMVVESRIFTFIASCLTFGLYYLYYLFCLEQERDSPFVPSRNKYKYWDKPYSSFESFNEFNEIQTINRNLDRLLYGSSNRDFKLVMKIVKDSWFPRAKMHLSIIFANILGFFEKWIVCIFRQDIQRENNRTKSLQKNIKDWFRFDKKTKDLIKNKIKNCYGVYDEEMDLINALATGLLGKKISPKRDYYLTFVFYVTYFLLSILTMGTFPVYHLLFKNRWSDFKNIRKHREHSQKMEFNRLTDQLVGDEGNVEYSYLLLGRNKLPLNLNFFSDAFRTKIFCSRLIRQKIVTFLMIITLGLFGVLIISKNVFDKPDLNISWEDSQMTDYSKIERRIDRFKFFILDLIRDLGVANKIAARRISTINRSINSLLESNNDKDFWIAKFMGLLSSELYFWLFSFIFILSGITGLSVWMYLNPDVFYLSPFFWISFSSMLFFLILFTRHIRLLFT